MIKHKIMMVIIPKVSLVYSGGESRDTLEVISNWF
jgi:hypothetical protein